MARRELHGARDGRHIRFGAAPLHRRHPLDLENHAAPQPHLGAGAVHLPFHLDGEVRRGVRRAHRDPRRRRCAGAAARTTQAALLDHLRSACRSVLHRGDRRSRRAFRVAHDGHRAGVARPRAADVDRVSRGAARLRAHVLPVSAGRLALPTHGRAALAQCGAHRRHGSAGANMNGWIIFILLIALMLTGMPISIALGLTVLSFLFFMTEVPAALVSQRLFTGLDQFAIMAIPFFILAGTFLTHGGVAKRMIRFATALVGHFHGGLAMAGVFACALFAAVSGSSPATVVAIGTILIPAMEKQGYPRKFGVGSIGTAGALGILIPPSIVMVIYSVSTNTSVGKLFIAGIVPGILLAALLMGITWVVAKRNDYPRMQRASLKEIWSAFWDAIWGLLLIVVVIGGIYGGVFTPTEAAAVSAVYAFVVAVFVYRDLKLSDVPKVLLDSANMSAMLLYIITNAMLFSFLLTAENIPQAMAQWIIDKHLSAWVFLLGVNILLLIAGNFMEPSSIVLLLAPILFPVAMKLGVDPIHFGIVMTINMEVGLIHPPVGLNLYVASGIAKMGLTETTIAFAPWLVIMVLYLLLLTYVPEIATWLPNSIYKAPG